MIAWISKNVTWIFSGVGVLIIGLIISLFARHKHQQNKSIKQKQVSGDNSANVQVGGDVRAPVNVDHTGGDKKENSISEED